MPLTSEDIQVRPGNRPLRELLASELNIHLVIAHLLTLRGITSAEQGYRFLHPSASHLYDPTLMAGIEKAISIIKGHIEASSKICIYGDYDVDGITSSLLLYETIKRCGGDVFVYLPDRSKDGYGLNMDALEGIIQDGIGLLITTDCGITAIDEVAYIRSKGISVIITDHHTPKEALPEADVVINPKQKQCQYPFKHLSGIGVAYKLAQHLCSDRLLDEMELVCLGTIADVMPLIDENRIIARLGLAQLSSPKRPGLKALVDNARLKRITAKNVAYVICPKLNAAGRVAHPKAAFELLSAADYSKALELSTRLDIHNRQRQQIEARVLDEAILQAQEQVSMGFPILLVKGDSWHPGVLGIVAARLVDMFQMPAAAVSFTEEGIGKGSARSCGDFNLHRFLQHHSNFFLKYGGHKNAAGFTIAADNWQDFVDSVVGRKGLVVKAADEEVCAVDCVLSLSAIDYSLASQLLLLEPFGEGNPNPIFLIRDVTIIGPIRRFARNAVKFAITDGAVYANAISFKGLESADKLIGQKADIIVHIGLNIFRGLEEIQIEVLDLIKK